MSIVIINNTPEPLEAFTNNEFNTLCCNVEDIIKEGFTGFDHIPDKGHIYFVSPANSLLFMDGGIDKAYMNMFPGIQKTLQFKMRSSSQVPTSILGRKYLPLGSAMIHRISDSYSIISAPTMLLPQNIASTNNAYHAMKAILNIWPCDGILVVPMLGTGYGKLTNRTASSQMRQATSEFYANFQPRNLETFYIPSLYSQATINLEQPKYYSNTEFFDIPQTQLVVHPKN